MVIDRQLMKLNGQNIYCNFYKFSFQQGIIALTYAKVILTLHKSKTFLRTVSNISQ